jgi:hypothetical protein
MKPLYQYVDQSPPSSMPTGGFGSTSGAGSANAISIAFSGSVKSITLIPDW